MNKKYEKWEPPPHDPYAMHPLDGRWVYVTTVEPDVNEDEFLQP